MNSDLKSLMTKKIVTIPFGTKAREAKALLSEKRLRHLPVVDNSQTVVGILSMSDLGHFVQGDTPVEYLMTSPVASVEESTSVRSVIFKMLELKISCVIVSNSKQEAVGLITTDDLLWHLAELLKDAGEEISLRDLFSKKMIGEIASGLSMIGI